jgi:DNA polymerase III alpha subunit
MNPANTDIDIDFADRDKALIGLHHIPAMLTNKNDEISRHPSGVYFQDAPINPITGLCSFEYKLMEAIGYFKIDFLNQSVYSKVRDEAHLDTLLNTNPPWELLDEPALVEQLAHIGNHFDIVTSVRPRSIDDLAVILALIRPGKRHLWGCDRKKIDAEVWKLDSDGYQFKRAHAISYAALIVVQMNLIVEQLSADDDGIAI